MTGADDNDAQGNRLVVTHALRSEGADASEDGTGRGTPMVVMQPETIPALTASAGRNMSPGHNRDELMIAAAIAGGNYGSGNMDEGVPNLVMEPTVRRLTPLECERLQGFPDGWTDNGQSDSKRYAQLGNAVAVPVIEWLGARLLDAQERLAG